MCRRPRRSERLAKAAKAAAAVWLACQACDPGPAAWAGCNLRLTSEQAARKLGRTQLALFWCQAGTQACPDGSSAPIALALTAVTDITGVACHNSHLYSSRWHPAPTGPARLTSAASARSCIPTLTPPSARLCGLHCTLPLTKEERILLLGLGSFSTGQACSFRA